jgi:predicted NUDIX family phosphoesterase
MSDKNLQQILVVPRSIFQEVGEFQGLSTNVHAYLNEFFAPNSGIHFTQRGPAEENPELKQLIPYVIFRDGNRYLRYRRGSGGGEKRLHAKTSLGIGGHIEDIDCEVHGTITYADYLTALKREIKEEIGLDVQDNAIHTVGIINDDSNPVGQVHLGILHIVDTQEATIAAAEPEIEDITFLTKENLEEDKANLESWSQLALATL